MTETTTRAPRTIWVGFLLFFTLVVLAFAYWLTQAAHLQPPLRVLSTVADFTLTNPNRLRSLVGTFAGNHWAFHSPDGRGYAFVASMIIAADKLNPQIAARLVPPLGRWRRLEPKRAEMMRRQLERIAATPALSRDVYEQVTKSLA